jgi:hypothetical protein
MRHLQDKVCEFRPNADACENWAMNVAYPDVRLGLLDVAKKWREMAERFERLHITLPFDDS